MRRPAPELAGTGGPWIQRKKASSCSTVMDGSMPGKMSESFGAGAGATATGPAPAPGQSTPPPVKSPPAQAAVPEVPTPVAAVPPGSVTISNAKAAALQEIKTAMDAVKQAQQSGNFSDYGAALQKLSDAMTKYDNAG